VEARELDSICVDADSGWPISVSIPANERVRVSARYVDRAIFPLLKREDILAS
jgi:hypothetical protein